MNITVIYYEQGTPKEEIQQTANMVADMMEGHKVIAIPRQFDLLLECSTDQLVMIRSIIDMALVEKMNTLPSVEEVVEEPDTSNWGGKIIDITKYLN